MAYESRDDQASQEFVPFDSGGRYGPPVGDPWRAPGPGYPPQQPQPQRRDIFGQPYGQPQPYGQANGQPPRGSDPRSGPQPRSNSGFFWDWR